jgi:parallel beta-helix repeat protein
MGLVVAASLAGLVMMGETASAYTPRAPIYIEGNGNFTAVNGVVGGDGTPSNPFVIEGWKINASSANGIEIRNSTAHFIIRDSYVHSGFPDHTGLYLYNVANGRLENTTVTNNRYGILLDSVANTVLSANAVPSNEELGIGLGYSTNVTIAGNNISSNRGDRVLNGDGIYVYYSDNVTIAGNNISSNDRHGLYLYRDTYVNVTGNNVSSNERHGVYLNQADDITLSGNNLSSNKGYGVYLRFSTNAVIKGNVLSSDGIFPYGDSLPHYGSHDITPDNIVNGKPLLYYRDCAGLDIDGVAVGQLIVANCTGVRAVGLEIADTEVGIVVAYSNDLLVSDSNVSGNEYGIYLTYTGRANITANTIGWNAQYGLYSIESTNVTLSGNNVTSNGQYGAYLRYATNVTLSGNNVTSNGWYGIYLVSPTDAAVVGNSVSGNGHGVFLWFSYNATIVGNHATSNMGHGVFLSSSTETTIGGNNLTSNTGRGIYLYSSTNATVLNNNLSANGYGVYVDSSTGIRLHHNNLLGNVQQALDTQGIENYWDDGYPSGGNYWSDYTGGDDCSGPGQDVCPDPDGIGDIPYVIDADSQDRYPSMEAYGFTNTPPVASFDASPSTGNLTTTFAVDASSSFDPQDPQSRLEVRWDWEDDAAWDTPWSTDKTAQHQYGALGNYTIRLEVRDTGGLANQTTRQVAVENTPPAASFNVTPTSGNATTIFLVDASPSWDLEDPLILLEVRWDWEDDGAWDTPWSSMKAAFHQYPSPGVHTIRLEVRDTGGLSGQSTRAVSVENTWPVASFDVSPPSGNKTTSFLVDGSPSYDLEDPTASLEVRWDWEDDGAWDTPWSTAKTATHQYASPGAYTIRLEVRDTGGLTDQTTRPVVVENDPPVASFTVAPPSGGVGTIFTVNASSSHDLEDPVDSLEVRWDWESDGTWDTPWSTGKVAQHQYTSPGGYTILLEVRDTGGLASQAAAEVVVENTPPTASFTVTPASGNVTTVFNVDASSSFDFEDAPAALEIRWDWEDDGTWDTAWSTVKLAQHQYSSPGSFTIRLEVRDTSGLVGETANQVSVVNTPPVAEVTVTPLSGDITTTFSVDASLSHDLEDSIAALEVRWDWEDDGTWDTAWSTDKTVDRQYSYPGVYTVRAEVRDTGGLTNETTTQVVVENTPPVASFDVAPSSGDVTTIFGAYAYSSWDLEDSSLALQVRWDWEDDGTWDTSWSTDKAATHQYAYPGIYAVRLEVKDYQGAASQTTRQIIVEDTPPLPSFSVSPSGGNVTTVFAMDASASSDLEDPGAALEVRWDWEDDGTWDTTWSTDKTGQHTYAEPGAYVVRLEVRDSGGLTASTTRDVTVSPAPAPGDTTPPTIEHEPPGDGEVGQALLCRVTVTDSGGVRSVYLYYRGVGETAYRAILMTGVGGNTYEAEIPPQVEAGEVGYYFVAVDSEGNEARGPATGENTVRVEGGTVPADRGLVGVNLVLLAVVLVLAAAVAVLLYPHLRRRREVTTVEIEEIIVKEIEDGDESLEP